MPSEIQQSDWDAVAQERESPQAQETPPVQTASPVQTESEGQQEQPKAAEDPYAGLHPEVQAKLKQFDQVAAALPDLVNQLKEAKGRIGTLQSEWAKAKPQGGPGPTQAQVTAAAKDPEKWAALKSDFPEWGEGIAEFVEARLGQLTGQGLTAEQVEQLVAQRAGEKTVELEQTFSKRLVELKHPGWQEEVKTPDFGAWFAAQSAAVQAKANSTDPLDAIALLDSWAEHKAKPVEAVQGARKQRLEQAVTTTKAPKQPAVKSFDQMTPTEQWEYLAAQRQS